MPAAMTNRPHHREEPEHERITRQNGGVAANGLAAARAQDGGERMRIQEQRERRAERQGGIGAVGARAVRTRHREQHFLRRNGGEDLREAAELDRDGDDDREGRDVDENILHDRDGRRRAQAARIGERREHGKGDDQRQVGGESGPRDPERADHDLNADELQRDVGQRRHDSRDGHGERQPAVPEPAAHEIRRRDIAAPVAHVPQPRKHEKQQRVDEDGVRHREERHGTAAEHEGRNGDEGIRGVHVSADEKPRDEGAETSPAETPFVQLVQIAAAPAGGRKPEPGDAAKEQDEDDQRNPVHLRHDTPLRNAERL